MFKNLKEKLKDRIFKLFKKQILKCVPYQQMQIQTLTVDNVGIVMLSSEIVITDYCAMSHFCSQDVRTSTRQQAYSNLIKDESTGEVLNVKRSNVVRVDGEWI